MKSISVEETGSELLELIEQVYRGEEVVITQRDRPVARIVPMPRADSHPQFGSAHGRIHMADDFDAPLDDFREYMQ